MSGPRWKYAPTDAIVVRSGNAGRLPVVSWIIHPPGQHPESPLVNDCTALECVTPGGSRWWDIVSGRINSELRMIVDIGDTRCELRSGWPDAPDPEAGP